MYFISLTTVAKLLWDWTTKYYWNLPPNLTGSIRPCSSSLVTPSKANFKSSYRNKICISNCGYQVDLKQTSKSEQTKMLHLPNPLKTQDCWLLQKLRWTMLCSTQTCQSAVCKVPQVNNIFFLILQAVSYLLLWRVCFSASQLSFVMLLCNVHDFTEKGQNCHCNSSPCLMLSCPKT